MSIVADRLASRLPVLCAAALVLTAATKSTTDPAHALAGRYYRQFPDGLVSGEKYTGEDVAEIVPVGPAEAYVRIHLDYYNGHSCSIFGVAHSEGPALVYKASRPQYDGRNCVLALRREGQSLSIDDAGGSCSSNCGARGTLSNVAIPYSSKRPIRYMARLKSSREYREALAEARMESK
jgi:hypothetical protein